VQSVRQALGDAGLQPRKLMIEITESLLLRDDEQVWDDLAELRGTGIRIAIDDFGTGYSSLSYLRHVPLDVLKIDRVFTRTIATSTRQSALVDSIVQLSHTLGLQVIAEGIETPQERDLLTRIGCHYGQGFLLSRPLSPIATTDWLTKPPTAAPTDNADSATGDSATGDSVNADSAGSSPAGTGSANPIHAPRG
jgi:EAL domain-containing protein (putative c-di-GMP-specific phosphodiesterase class I)